MPLLEELRATYPKNKALDKFLKSHIVYAGEYLSSGTLYQGSRLAKLIEAADKRCVCEKCNVEGSIVLEHRHKNEDETVRHVDVFMVSERSWLLMTVDHILPKSCGGKDSETNYRIYCCECNQARRATVTPDEMLRIINDLPSFLSDKPEERIKFPGRLKNIYPNYFNMPVGLL